MSNVGGIEWGCTAALLTDSSNEFTRRFAGCYKLRSLSTGCLTSVEKYCSVSPHWKSETQLLCELKRRWGCEIVKKKIILVSQIYGILIVSSLCGRLINNSITYSNTFLPHPLTLTTEIQKKFESVWNCRWCLGRVRFGEAFCPRRLFDQGK